jgi:hypothetical protein
MLMTAGSAVLFALYLCLGPAKAADPIRIVSWNASPSLYEALEARLSDFRKIADDLTPDVLVLIEVAGEQEVKRIADALGWSKYHAVVTNWSELSVQVHFALEAAVISKVPIIRAIEYDASPDGHHQAFSHQGPVAGIVSEQVLSSQGIAGFGDPLAPTDRGTFACRLGERPDDLAIAPQVEQERRMPSPIGCHQDAS